MLQLQKWAFPMGGMHDDRTKLPSVGLAQTFPNYSIIVKKIIPTYVLFPGENLIASFF